MIVYNNQQQLTGHCSFQEYSVLLQSPPRNNGNQGQHAIIIYQAYIKQFQAQCRMSRSADGVFKENMVFYIMLLQLNIIQLVMIESWSSKHLLI